MTKQLLLPEFADNTAEESSIWRGQEE